MKKITLLLASLVGVFSVLPSVFAGDIVRCDGDALVIYAVKIGNPEMGHGYWSVRLTLNDRGIARYFAEAGAYSPYEFHPDWNDAFVTLTDLRESDRRGDYHISQYVTGSGYDPKTREVVITFSRSGYGAALEAYPVIGTYNGGAPVFGNRLADWGFRSCR